MEQSPRHTYLSHEADPIQSLFCVDPVYNSCTAWCVFPMGYFLYDSFSSASTILVFIFPVRASYYLCSGEYAFCFSFPWSVSSAYFNAATKLPPKIMKCQIGAKVKRTYVMFWLKSLNYAGVSQTVDNDRSALTKCCFQFVNLLRDSKCLSQQCHNYDSYMYLHCKLLCYYGLGSFLSRYKDNTYPVLSGSSILSNKCFSSCLSDM